jgi:hypothetical protein
VASVVGAVEAQPDGGFEACGVDRVSGVCGAGCRPVGGGALMAFTEALRLLIDADTRGAVRGIEAVAEAGAG